MRKFYIFGLIGLVLVIAGSALAEEVTLTTYYPAPYGVYKNLRLYPGSAPTCNANQRGLLYYNSSNNTIYVCNGTGWQSLSLPRWWIASGNNIYNTNPGFVGVKMTNPDAPLTVLGYMRLRARNARDNWYANFHSGWSWAHPFSLTVAGGFSSALELIGAYLNAGSRETALMYGNVGVGITNPSQKLDINGQIRIRGGSPGLEKVLTSDASGVGSWKDLPAAAGYWDISGNSIYNTNTSGVIVNAPRYDSPFQVKGRVSMLSTRGRAPFGTGAGNRTANTRAMSDLFVVGTVVTINNGDECELIGYVAGIERAYASVKQYGDGQVHKNSFTMPVRKGEFWYVKKKTNTPASCSSRVYYLQLGNH